MEQGSAQHCLCTGGNHYNIGNMVITLSRNQASLIEGIVLGRVISFSTPKGEKACGRVMSAAVEVMRKEPVMIFVINHRRYESDLNYFLENTILYGSTNAREDGSIRWPPEGD